MVLDTIKKNTWLGAELEQLMRDGRSLSGLTNLLEHEKSELKTMLVGFQESGRELELEEKAEKAIASSIKKILDDIERLTWEIHQMESSMQTFRATRGLTRQGIDDLKNQIVRFSSEIFQLSNAVKGLDRYLEFFERTSRAFEGKTAQLILMLQDIRKWGAENSTILRTQAERMKQELEQMSKEATQR